MNVFISWHILAKDFRRFRFLVLAAAALTAFAAWLPLHPRESLDRMDPSELAGGLRLVLVAILGLAIVRDDPATGVKGAWLSRPIGRGQLVAAKLLFIGIFLAAPSALAGAGGALALSAGGRAAVLAALVAGMPALLAAAAGALLGSLHRSYLRAIVTAAALLVVAEFGQHYWAALINLLTAPRALGFGQFPPEVDYRHKYLWMTAGPALACVAALIFQFLRRRAGQAAALIALLLALTQVASTGWPWTAWHPQSPPPANQSPPVQLTPTARELSVERIDQAWFPRPDSIRLSLPVQQGAGGDVDLSWSGQSRFTADDGRTFVMPETQGIASEWLNFAAAQAGDQPAVLNFAPFGWPTAQLSPKTFAAGVLTLPRPEYERLRGARGHLETWVQFYQPRLGIQGQIPCVPGAEFSRPGGRLRIRSVFVLPNGDVNVTVELARLDLFGLIGDSISMGPFVLINPVRHELAMVYRQFGSRSENPVLATVSRVEIFPFHHVWSLATHQRSGDLDEAWMKDAQLAVETYLPGKEGPMSLIDWGEVTLPSELAKE